MSIAQLQGSGLEELDDNEIRRFVSSESTGVLGLPADDVPYLLPMSYAFDDDSRLYFTYLLGASSRKELLSERAERAQFLVFAIETAFNWRSVLLTGTISAVPEREYAELENVLTAAWRPELFRRAGTPGEVKVYEFRIEDQSGIRHTGLPPGFQDDE